MTRGSDREQARAEELEFLAQAGIPLVGDDDAPGVRAECMRVARRLAASGMRSFGLIPINDRAAVPPVAIQLGVALMDLSGATVAYVDANTAWPAMPIADATAETRLFEDEPFSLRWLFRSLALVVPRVATSAGDAVPKLEWALGDGGSLFKHILVDLTGFDQLGEREAALDLVDGVILVAHPKQTTEREILKARDILDPERILGALLVD